MRRLVGHKSKQVSSLALQLQGTHKTLISKLRAKNIKQLTQVQKLTYQPLSQAVHQAYTKINEDVFLNTPDRTGFVIQAPTGSGKSIAFLLPIVNQITNRALAQRLGKAIHAIVFVPHPILGEQITKEIYSMLPRDIGDQVLHLDFDNDEVLKDKIKETKPSILVTTAGRFLKLMGGGKKSNNIVHSLVSDISNFEYLDKIRHQLKHVKYVVVDEGRSVVQPLSKYSSTIKKQQRQKAPTSGVQALNLLLQLCDPVVVFASATINHRLRRVIETAGWVHQPQILQTDDCREIPSGITHSVLLIDEEFTFWNTIAKLTIQLADSFTLIVVHSNTYNWKAIPTLLQKCGVNSKCLEPGDTVREGCVLVASADYIRGVDFEGKISKVINIGKVMSTDDYIHTAGRTGRMGTTGEVINILSNKQLQRFRKMVQFLNLDLRLHSLSGRAVKEELHTA